MDLDLHIALRWVPFGRYIVSEAGHVWAGKMVKPQLTRKGYHRYYLYDSEFGVTANAIYKILRRDSWAHLGETNDT